MAQKDTFYVGNTIAYNTYFEMFPEFSTSKTRELLSHRGQIAGFMAPEILIHRFGNLVPQTVNGQWSSYMEDSRTNSRILVRVLSDGGVGFQSSSAVGLGRTNDPDSQQEHLKVLDHFIIMDIREYPKLCFYSLPTSVLYVESELTSDFTRKYPITKMTPALFDLLAERMGIKFIEVAV